MFGRHFKRCSSKVSGRDGHKVDYEVLRPICRILKSYFPEHVVFYWDDLPESKRFMRSPSDEELKEKFYLRRASLILKDSVMVLGPLYVPY